MYIEKNGFIVVYPEEISFLTEDRDFSDCLDFAEIFSSNTSALEAIKQFENGEKTYVVLKYNCTIWIDKDAEQPEKGDCNMCFKSEDYDSICEKIKNKIDDNAQ